MSEQSQEQKQKNSFVKEKAYWGVHLKLRIPCSLQDVLKLVENLEDVWKVCTIQREYGGGA